MEKEKKHRTTKNNFSNKLSSDDKLIALIFSILFIFILVVLFNKTQLKGTKEETFIPLNPSPPGIKIERYENRISTIFKSKQSPINEIQVFSEVLRDEKYAKGLGRTIELYNSGFYQEAFLKFATVSENLLIKYIQQYAPSSEPKVHKAIKYAYKANIIAVSEKNCLLKIMSIRNILAHEPDPALNLDDINRYFSYGAAALRKISINTQIS
jgi:hypothetical protein